MTVKEWIYSFEGHWSIYIFGCAIGAISALIACWISGVLCL